MKINININTKMPAAKDNKYKHKDLHEKVKEYIFCCESDNESEYHWRYLKYLYNKLHARKNLPDIYKPMMGELEGFMSKYGGYDSGEDQAHMTGENLFKYRDGG